MKVYFISGLGADHRAFQHLTLPGIDQVHLAWETPSPNESLQAYCHRFLQKIDQTEEINLVGLSFGGIVSQEIARLVPCKKVILLSTIKSEQELDWRMKFIKATRLYALFPPSALNGLGF